jgi:hypothetical protein
LEAAGGRSPLSAPWDTVSWGFWEVISGGMDAACYSEFEGKKFLLLRGYFGGLYPYFIDMKYN